MGDDNTLRNPNQLKQGLVFALGTGVIAFVLLWLWQEGSFNSRVLLTMDPWPLLFAISMMPLSWVVQVRSHALLTNVLGYTVPSWRLFRFYMTGAFVAGVTPNSQGGVPVVAYLLHRDGMSWGEASAVSIITSALIVFVLVLLIPVLVLAGALAQATLYRVILGLAGLAAIILFTLLFFRPQQVGNRLIAFVSWRGWFRLFSEERVRSAAEWLDNEVTRFADSVNRIFTGHPWVVLQVLIYSILHWVLYLAIPPALLYALDVPFAWSKIIFVQVIFFFLEPLIPTPGASGGAELGLAALFAPIVPSEVLGTVIVLWRLITFYLSLAVGGLTTFSMLGEYWLHKKR